MIRGDLAEESVFHRAAALVRSRQIDSDAEVAPLLASVPPDADPDVLKRLRQMYEAGGWVLVESALADLPSDLRWLYESGAVSIDQLAAIHRSLGSTSSADLAWAIGEQKIRAIPGLSAAVEEAIAAALPTLRATIPRVPLGRAVTTAEPVLDRLRAVPGVESASIAATVPFGMISLGRGVQRSAEATDKPIHARLNIVGEDYFRTLGVPVLRGREFGPQEMQAGSAEQIAIIDQTAAQRLWPNQNPLGQRLHLSPEGTDPARDVEIVGVVGGIHENIVGQGVEPHLYLPFGQRYQSDLNFHLKTAAMGTDAEARLLDTVRREVRAEDNKLPVLNFRTMKQHLEGSMDLWIVRTGATMFTIFGAVAMFLAVIGLYGLKAYTVAQRTREIGIRMALGAAAGENLRMILKEGLVLTLIGVAVGVALSLGLGAVLAGMLYQVSGADPVIFSVTPLLLIAVSMVACYFPARRAARVDPMVALRDE